jgi:SAM-dependent methyltransferase
MKTERSDALRHDPHLSEYVTRPEIAQDYDRYFRHHPLFRHDPEFVRNHVFPGSVVLDCGAGTGRHVVELSRERCTVVGLDLSAPMLQEAAQKIRRERVTARLLQADMTRLPFRPGLEFDAILLMFSTLGLIYPAARRLRLLKDLRAHLAADGGLLLHVHNENYRYSPHRNALDRIVDRCYRLFGDFEPGDHIVENYRGIMDLRLHSFRRAELEELLRAAGYDILVFEGLNDERDGPCEFENIDTEANGFYVLAQPA